MKSKKTGTLNLYNMDVDPKARLLCEKRGRSYNLDIIKMLTPFNDKRVCIKIEEVLP